MTYAQGGLIQATDYNTFVTTGSPNLNNIWSTGSANSGYGQSVVPVVSTGDIVRAAEWGNLINFTANSALHQGSTIAAVTAPPVGNIIAYIATLSTNLVTINSNRLNAATVGTDITTTGTRFSNWGSNIAIPTVSSTITVTFASANQARYYFNAGGAVLVNCSRSGGSGNGDDLAWSTLCTSIGSLGLPASNVAQSIASASYLGLTKFSGSGTPSTYTRSGFYNLTSTPVVLFKQYASGGLYTSDYIQLSYSTTGSVLTITVDFNDADSVFPITGNLAVTAIARQPESTYLTNSWGTPIVAVSAPA